MEDRCIVYKSELNVPNIQCDTNCFFLACSKTVPPAIFTFIRRVYCIFWDTSKHITECSDAICILESLVVLHHYLAVFLVMVAPSRLLPARQWAFCVPWCFIFWLCPFLYHPFPCFDLQLLRWFWLPLATCHLMDICLSLWKLRNWITSCNVCLIGPLWNHIDLHKTVDVGGYLLWWVFFH